MPEMTLAGETFAYAVRKSKRAKRVSLRFHPERGFELVVPLRQRIADAEAIWRENQSWALRMLERARKAEARPMFRRQYHDGATMPYLGRPLVMRLVGSLDAARIDIKMTPERFEVRLPQCSVDDQDLWRDGFERMYRRMARAYLPRRVEALAAARGFEYRQIRIKNQKTRWGSCSAKRNLNFNLRLMMTPPAAIDYIIIHELCHLVELNHSPRFWDLVARHCPEHERWRRWFKDNSSQLRF